MDLRKTGTTRTHAGLLIPSCREPRRERRNGIGSRAGPETNAPGVGSPFTQQTVIASAAPL